MPLLQDVGGLFDARNKIHGTDQICFASPTAEGLTFYWLFVICEIISGLSSASRAPFFAPSRCCVRFFIQPRLRLLSRPRDPRSCLFIPPHSAFAVRAIAPRSFVFRAARGFNAPQHRAARVSRIIALVARRPLTHSCCSRPPSPSPAGLRAVLTAVSLNWRVIRRGARSLEQLSPPFPKEHWPTVDVCICHYSEAADETMATLQKALALEYPPSKLRIVVCDDGHFKVRAKRGGVSFVFGGAARSSAIDSSRSSPRARLRRARRRLVFEVAGSHTHNTSPPSSVVHACTCDPLGDRDSSFLST